MPEALPLVAEVSTNQGPGSGSRVWHAGRSVLSLCQVHVTARAVVSVDSARPASVVSRVPTNALSGAGSAGAAGRARRVATRAKPRLMRKATTAVFLSPQDRYSQKVPRRRQRFGSL